MMKIQNKKHNKKEGELMKSNKGITLSSLVIYITVTLMALAILTTIMASFQYNINSVGEKGTNSYEIDKFNMYFLQEVKKQENDIISITSQEIQFKSGNIYTFANRSIYLNSIKIAEKIEDCSFEKIEENNKTIVRVIIEAKGIEPKTKEYVLNN